MASRHLIQINGDYQEGGGQILRTSLALAALTGQGFVISDIRKKRSPPGLKAQHLSGVQLAAQLCGAQVEGANLGSTRLTFRPGPLRAGTFRQDIGTAGSVPLLLQASLLPALRAPGPVRLELTGGTDVRGGPPMDYVSHVLLPYYRMLGQVQARVERRGFYPRGGGRVVVDVHGHGSPPPPADLVKRGTYGRVHAWAVASLDLAERRVAERLADTAAESLGALPHHEYSPALSPSCALVLTAQSTASTAWPLGCAADRLGERGLPAEKVAAVAVKMLRERLEHPAPVEEHLADNLIPLLGLAGGALRCQVVSPHTLANIYVVSTFLGVDILVEEDRIACPKPRF